MVVRDGEEDEWMDDCSAISACISLTIERRLAYGGPGEGCKLNAD
jgi:hypothetical protein